MNNRWTVSIAILVLLGGTRLGLGQAARADDGARRPRIVYMIGEKEYDTRSSLPVFHRKYLQPLHVAATFVHADEDDPNRFPGLEAALKDADLLFVSVRRRTPPAGQLDTVRRFIASGKPVVGIRTASHAFALRKGDPPAGHAHWPGFDRDVFGGNYHLHHGNKGDDAPRTLLRVAHGASDHPIVAGVPTGEFVTPSWLYKTSLLTHDCTVLLMGRVEGRQPDEPVAWTRTLPTGNRVFYTSLGHVDEFAQTWFARTLRDGVLWALDRPIPTPGAPPPDKSR